MLHADAPARDAGCDGELPACITEWMRAGAVQPQTHAAEARAPPPRVTKVVLEGESYAVVDVDVKGMLTLQVRRSALHLSRVTARLLTLSVRRSMRRLVALL